MKKNQTATETIVQTGTKKIAQTVTQKTFLMATLITVFAMGCSRGLQTQSSTSSNTGQQGASSTPGANTPNVTAPAIDSVQMKSYVEDNTNGFNGALAFDLDKVRGEFIIMIPLPAGMIFTPSGSFSNYPDITYGPIFDAEGRMKIAVRVPVRYVLKGVQFGSPSRLPNGDPLPAMPAGQGELPGLALTFPQNSTQITLYIGLNALGLFASLPEGSALDKIPFGFTLPLKSQDKTRTFGYLTFVPKKGTYAPGLFISTGVPANMARILEDYFKL